MEGVGTPFGSKIQLYCEHGYFLRILESGAISGTQEKFDLYTGLELTSGNDIGTVRIRGMQSQLYICFDDMGNIYGECNAEAPGTTFKEELHGSYNSYECTDYPGWLLGISKAGNGKNGNRTKFGKKSTRFLPVRV